MYEDAGELTVIEEYIPGNSLEELLEKYPLAYDRERFTVDYRFLGGNLLPDITILED